MQKFTFEWVEDDSYCAMSYTGDEAEVEIPASHCDKPVTILYDGLFRGHAEITSVRIPDSVTTLGGFVFEGCENLRRVKLPNRLENMWQYAFARSSVEELVVPGTVRTIVPFTFKDCKRLKKVTCLPGLKEVCSWAFEGCDQLDEFYTAPGVKISPLLFESPKK